MALPHAGGPFLAETRMADPSGLARGLTQYGDRDYALYLRRSYARSMAGPLRYCSTQPRRPQ